VKGSVQHLNPDGLHKNPAYSQAVVVTGNVTTVYVGGQNAVDASGKVVGKGDIKAQSEQVLENLGTALAAGGRSWSTSSSGTSTSFRQSCPVTRPRQPAAPHRHAIGSESWSIVA
jgi:enamine deaminase RidA (YjgF/YER057c/UK114 family)